MLYCPQQHSRETPISSTAAHTAGGGPIITRNFILLVIGGFNFYTSMWLVMLFLPPYVLQLGGSESQIGLVLSAFAFTALLSRPLVGRAVDTLGCKGVALAGCAVFAVSPILYFLAPSTPVLIAARLFHGFGISFFGTAGMTWVADIVPPTRRAEAMGLYSNTSQIAIALAPLFGALIFDRGGFDSLFLVAAVVGAASIVLVSRAQEEKRATDVRRSAGSFSDALGRRDVLAMTFALLTAAATWGILTAFLPIFAAQRQAGATAPFFTIYAVVTIGLRLLIGPMADRVGRRIVIAPALLLLAATMAAFNAVSSPYTLYALAIGYGASFGMLFPTLSAYLVDVAPAHVRGSAISVLTAGFDVGIMVGAYLGGLAAESLGLGATFTAAGVLCLAGVAVFWIGTGAAKKV